MQISFKMRLWYIYVQRPNSGFVFSSVFLLKLKELKCIQFLTVAQQCHCIFRNLTVTLGTLPQVVIPNLEVFIVWLRLFFCTLYEIEFNLLLFF